MQGLTSSKHKEATSHIEALIYCTILYNQMNSYSIFTETQ